MHTQNKAPAGTGAAKHSRPNYNRNALAELIKLLATPKGAGHEH